MITSFKKYLFCNSIKYWILAVCVVLLNSICNAQVVVKMKLDTADIVVGQQVQLSTSVSADKNQRVVFPEYDNDKKWLVEGVEVIRQSKIDTVAVNDNKRVELNCQYTITAFDSALFTIPPFEVEVDGKKFQSSSSLGLKVNYIPVDTTKVEEFAPPHGIVPEIFVWKYEPLFFALGIWPLLIVLLVVALALTRKKPLTLKKVIKPLIPPYKEASIALQRVTSFKVEDQETEKQFYVELTDLLRNYIQRRFNVLAMEKTSYELLQQMEGLVDATEMEGLKLIFENADLVKFAKHRTSDFEKERCLTAAKKFLDHTVDDTMEHPKPEVHVVVLNDGMQRGYRIALWTSFALLVVGIFVYTYFVSNHIYEIYFN